MCSLSITTNFSCTRRNKAKNRTNDHVHRPLPFVYQVAEVVHFNCPEALVTSVLQLALTPHAIKRFLQQQVLRLCYFLSDTGFYVAH